MADFCLAQAVDLHNLSFAMLIHIAKLMYVIVLNVASI